MGDPSFQDQTNHIKIEGVTYTDTDPYDDDQDEDAFGDFDEVTLTVTITDGKLTLSPSTGCYNTKLMFIEVTPIGGGGGTATPGLAAATYKYDALGRRLQKTVAGVATTFVHDGDQVVAEYEGTTLKRRYIYGTYIDEPLAMVTSTGTLYYHQNRVYSVMAMTNSSGQLAERYGYTPYGKRRVVAPGGATLAASAVGNQVGFTGRYHDGETGLTYFRARYQDAELGRFVGRDPLGIGRPARFSATVLLYAYGDGNPAGRVDPMGLAACCPGDPGCPPGCKVGESCFTEDTITPTPPEPPPPAPGPETEPEPTPPQAAAPSMPMPTIWPRPDPKTVMAVVEIVHAVGRVASLVGAGLLVSRDTSDAQDCKRTYDAYKGIVCLGCSGSDTLTVRQNKISCWRAQVNGRKDFADRGCDEILGWTSASTHAQHLENQLRQGALRRCVDLPISDG